MNVIPMGKGYVAGKLSFSFCPTYASSQGANDSQSTFQISTGKLETLPATLIEWKWTHCAQYELHPNRSSIQQLCYVTVTIDPSVKAIIVVEKEGVFSRLISSSFTE